MFFILGLHVCADSVMAELNSMDDVYDQAAVHFGTPDGVILLDLDADSCFPSQAQLSTVDLVRDAQFLWLVDGEEDTTTTSSRDCSHNRY